MTVYLHLTVEAAARLLCQLRDRVEEAGEVVVAGHGGSREEPRLRTPGHNPMVSGKVGWCHGVREGRLVSWCQGVMVPGVMV